ncbi:MAG: histidinol-phosphate aminotransferase family protein [Oscillospiraceae bacterium]|jgi:histidinol-phosphate aminotransferase|nr:histidinol-phosphate aminotransferase family protein [Oscillospiraceae bacterium]
MLIPEKIKTIAAPLPELLPADIVVDANESFRLFPEDIAREMAEELAATPLNRYPDPLARKVCLPAAEYYGVGAEQITAGCGSDELISVIVNALVPPEGRLLLCEPDFGTYRFCAELRGCVCVASKRVDGRPDLAALLNEAREGDCVIFSNPCNPTGQGIAREETLDMVRRAPCLVVVDEAYMDFWDQSAVSAIGELENLIILRTASKSVGLASIRLGFALAGETLTGFIRKAKLPYNVTGPTQSIGAAAYRHPEWLRQNAATLRESAQNLFGALSALLAGREGYGLTDTITNFILLCPPDAQELYKFLLARGIRVRILGGARPLLRITGGAENENAAVIAAIGEFIKEGNTP